MNKRLTLKNMLGDRETYFVPGVFDCIGALAVEAAGFQAALVSGNAVSASALGLPDMGLLTMTEVVRRLLADCPLGGHPGDRGRGHRLWPAAQLYAHGERI